MLADKILNDLVMPYNEVTKRLQNIHKNEDYSRVLLLVCDCRKVIDSCKYITDVMTHTIELAKELSDRQNRMWQHARIASEPTDKQQPKAERGERD